MQPPASGDTNLVRLTYLQAHRALAELTWRVLGIEGRTPGPMYGLDMSSSLPDH